MPQKAECLGTHTNSGNTHHTDDPLIQDPEHTTFNLALMSVRKEIIRGNLTWIWQVGRFGCDMFGWLLIAVGQ